MKTIKKILCAVDLSQHSDEVVEYAKLFAEPFNAEVIVIYAAPDLAQYVGLHVPPSSLETTIQKIITGAEKNMEEFVAKHFPDKKAVGIVVYGYPAEEILASADSKQVDMIIMGTHGRKGLNRCLFGSVAEKVVKSSSIPVLTVHPQAIDE